MAGTWNRSRHHIATLLCGALLAGVASPRSHAQSGAPPASASQALAGVPAEVTTILAQGGSAGDPTQALLAGRVAVRTQLVPERLEAFVVAAVRIASPLERTVAYFHQFTAYVDGQVTQQFVPFHQPPSDADVSALVLDASDLADLRLCAPTACDIRLGALSPEALRTTSDWTAPDASAAATALARRAVLSMLTDYQARGDRALTAHDNTGTPVDTEAMWREIVAAPSVASALAPALQRHLASNPSAVTPQATHTYYWDKQRLTGLKPILGVTHMIDWRDDVQPGRVIVVQKQIAASHHLFGALAMTLFVSDSGAALPTTYVVYANRVRGDLLRGTQSTSQTGLRARIGNLGAAVQRRAGEQLVQSSTERLLSGMKEALER